MEARQCRTVEPRNDFPRCHWCKPMTVTDGTSVIDLVLQHETSIYFLCPGHPNIGIYSFEATENSWSNYKYKPPQSERSKPNAPPSWWNTVILLWYHCVLILKLFPENSAFCSTYGGDYFIFLKTGKQAFISEGGEDLGGIGRGETVIRIYHLKKIFFNSEKFGSDWQSFGSQGKQPRMKKSKQILYWFKGSYLVAAAVLFYTYQIWK